MIIIPIKPKPAPRPRVTRRGAYNPKEYTDYKSIIGLAYKAKFGAEKSTKPITLAVEFIFKYPKSWSKKKKDETLYHTSKPDVDNLVKSIKDALNGIAYIDDSQVWNIQASKRYDNFEAVKIKIN